MNDNPYSAPQAEIQVEVATEITRKRPLATRWQRFAGSLIDAFVLYAGYMFFGTLTIELLDLFYPEYFEMAGNPVVSIVESLVALAILALFFLAVNGYLLSTRGQTLGKLAVKTQIVSDRDELVPLTKIFLARYLAFWCFGMIPVFGSFLSLADATMIFRNNHKCLHDEFAGTKVVMLTTPAHHRQLPDKLDLPEQE